MENRLLTVSGPGRAGFEPSSVLEATVKLEVAWGLLQPRFLDAGLWWGLLAVSWFPADHLEVGPAFPEQAGEWWAEPLQELQLCKERLVGTSSGEGPWQ